MSSPTGALEFRGHSDQPSGALHYGGGGGGLSWRRDRKNESPLKWWPRKWEKRKSPGHGEEDKGRGRPSHLSGSRVSNLGDGVMNTHYNMQCVLIGELVGARSIWSTLIHA